MEVTHMKQTLSWEIRDSLLLAISDRREIVLHHLVTCIGLSNRDEEAIGLMNYWATQMQKLNDAAIYFGFAEVE
jgi:hypothetical protein